MTVNGRESPRALVFDCDGVLAETERDVHLPAFNQAFEDFGLPVRWTDRQYAKKLLVAGGKERMATSIGPELVGALGRSAGGESIDQLLRRLHVRKAEIAAEILAAHPPHPRPGVRRLMTAAHAAGWKLAVASTSAEATVRLVARGALGAPLSNMLCVFAGDVVPAKKPHRAIYELAVATLEVDKKDTIVIEDSRNGLRAAHAAGLSCVITESDYTRGEDFSEAALVLSSLGDPDVPMVVLANRSSATPQGHLTLTDLEEILSGRDSRFSSG
jgi:HAD superfamily hydrolase (TIGR01509 family)